ncbi:hypothetical protein B0H16DRAFT_1491794, partial [Mycena metata]
RLTHALALVNNEVTEVSSKTLLHEPAEATTISSHAQSVGWIRGSRPRWRRRTTCSRSGTRRASGHGWWRRFAVLKERTSKLQTDVRRLQNALEEQREHRLESSESIIVDARARLEALHRATTGVGAGVSQVARNELTTIIETLVSDNEMLKRDNAELPRGCIMPLTTGTETKSV